VTNPDPDVTNSMTLCHAGIPIRAYSFPEEDPGLNLYAPFRYHIAYLLACFFNRAKTSQGNIEQCLREGILQGLNPGHHVQFHSAYTTYKLVDATTNKPRWQSGLVDCPLLNGLQFHYRNIILVVKYLLRQKSYAGDMVWGPQQEYDREGSRVYSKIITAIWWDDNQVCISDILYQIGD